MSCTWSTNGSFLLVLAKRLRRTAPGCCYQDGNEDPNDGRCWKLKNLSCGVVLVEVESSDLIQ